MKRLLSIIPALLTLLLSSCSQSEQSHQNPKLATPADAEKYTVVKTQHGKSSWYSVRTNHGTRTASGIPLRDKAFTIAHRTLPFGTKVRVTNVNNGKSAIATVTDRGPFIRKRIVDLSLGLAKHIGAYHSGIATCKLEVLKLKKATAPLSHDASPSLSNSPPRSLPPRIRR